MLALAAVGPAGSGTQGAPALASWVGRAERAVRSASRPPPPLRGAAARRTRVPILMYHLIHAAPAAAPYPELWVPPRRFAAQMRALHRGGYTGVTLRDALAAWRGGAPLPRRPVVVSFDDGYASQGAVAFRVLHRLGWPGVNASRPPPAAPATARRRRPTRASPVRGTRA